MGTEEKSNVKEKKCIKRIKKYRKAKKLRFIAGSTSIVIAGGAIANYLVDKTGKHGIIEGLEALNQDDKKVSQIQQYLVDNNIKLVIELQEAEDVQSGILDIEYGSGPEYAFVEKLIRYTCEYEFGDIAEEQGAVSVVTKTADNLSLCANATKECEEVTYIALQLNKMYCSGENEEYLIHLIEALEKIIKMLSNVNWEAIKKEVFRLWQASEHKPQDKVELIFSGQEMLFEENSLLNICTYSDVCERVRLHKIKDVKALGLSSLMRNSEYLFLTNRLIENLYNREWIQGKEEIPGLKGAPIIVYENAPDTYEIGVPKADMLDGIYFSTKLYEKKYENLFQYDYVVYNRYTDSSYFLESETLDYGDNGRVKDAVGHMGAEKVMIPRYYKRLLGYMDFPLVRIRSEEYLKLLTQLSEEDRECFAKCYKNNQGESFYYLSKKEQDKEVLKYICTVQQEKGLYDTVELIKIPKNKEKKVHWMGISLRKLRDFLLKMLIDKSEYLLKVEWTSETDDRNNVARMNSNMMTLLGVSENDKIVIKFGNKHEILRVLAKDELTDYQIGIPAPARKRLGMNSVNDIVVVHRDMVHILLRHSEAQTVTLIGTVLAVCEVTSVWWMRIALSIVIAALLIYLVLNEERVKVK